MVSPRYQKVRPLGAGGMGEVWLGRDTASQAQPWVALKRLHPGLARDPGLARQFEREGQIGAQLQHENIVSVREYLLDAEGPLLVLEYVEGPNVSGLLKALEAEQRQVPVGVGLSIARDVALALAYAHSVRMEGEERCGIVHRDLSPDNILLDLTGLAKLADFGIARSLDSTSLTHSGTVKGKFGFLAPELLEGSSADFRADVFSLAATLFTLLCGVRPFHGRTEAEQVRALLQSEPPRLNDLRPDVPDAVAGWIQQGLRRLPAERPGDTQGLLEALDGLLPTPADSRREVAACIKELALFMRDGVPPSGSLENLGETAARSRGSRARWLLFAGGGLLAAAGTFALLPHGPRRTAPATEARAPTLPTVPLSSAAVSSPRLEAAAPSPPRATAPPPERTVQASRATLWVKVAPWAQVFLDGKLLGMTPLEPLAVPPGHHSLILVNQDLGLRRRVDVQVHSHENKVIRVDLAKR